MKLFKQLSEKLSTKGKKVSNQGMIKPIDVNFDISKNEFYYFIFLGGLL